jgi:hypothetical protein
MKNSQLLQTLVEEKEELKQEIAFLKRTIKESEETEVELAEKVETLEFLLTETCLKIVALRKHK